MMSFILLFHVDAVIWQIKQIDVDDFINRVFIQKKRISKR